MIVAKFGGSSVKNAEAIKRCGEIVQNNRDIGVVIISATYNTTNELEEVFRELGTDPSAAKVQWTKIKVRHEEMARELGEKCLESAMTLFIELDELFLEMSKRDLDLADKDLLLSFGERLSSRLMFEYLSSLSSEDRVVQLIPAPAFLKTDSSFGLAKPKIESIKLYSEGLFRSGLEKGSLFVTQGFIGSDGEDRVTTLGREGSDYTATLLGSALVASEVIIYTDVEGIFSSDPNIVEGAIPIDTLSYEEATLLAKSGAKVLFPSTLKPVIDLSIPVRVASSLNPSGHSTLIQSTTSDKPGIKGMALKERSDGLIITLVGSELDELDIEQSEIDRGPGFRSFFLANGDAEETLILWHDRYLKIK